MGSGTGGSGPPLELALGLAPVPAMLATVLDPLVADLVELALVAPAFGLADVRSGVPGASPEALRTLRLARPTA